MFLDMNQVPILRPSVNDEVYTIEEDYNERPDLLAQKLYDSSVLELNSLVEEFKLEGLDVTVTMYHPVRSQTDSTPNILADGTRIRTQKASEYRFIAVSRNLLKRWGGPLDYGDFVILRNTQSHKDGLYQVRDTMNPRWVNRIDILETPGTPPYRLVGEILIADMEKNT